MPFDGKLPVEQVDGIEAIKAAVRKWRAKGRLICDNAALFEHSELETWHEGTLYVCAIGACERETGCPGWYRSGETASLLRAMMKAHDMLWMARRNNAPPRVVEDWERRFARLIGE
jgi:hypothetical protein